MIKILTAIAKVFGFGADCLFWFGALLELVEVRCFEAIRKRVPNAKKT